MTDLRIYLQPPFALDVSTDWGDGGAENRAAVPFARAAVLLLSMDGQAMNLSEEELADSKKIAGLHAGRYAIEQGLVVPEHYLAEVLMDGRDVLGQEVEIDGPRSLKLIYKTDGGKVLGTVKDEGMETMAILVSEKPDAAKVEVVAPCDRNGAFTISDLAPGEYMIAAFQHLPVDASDAQFQNAMRANGKSIRVEAGATATVELRIN